MVCDQHMEKLKSHTIFCVAHESFILIKRMFVHLRLHSEFSIVDSSIRIDEVVKAAADDGQAALALTDLGNLFGALKMYKAARKAGIKPILGAEVWLAENEALGIHQASRVILLVQNQQGYHNLCDLLSRAWVENVVRDQAQVKWDWLDKLSDGLILLTGAAAGPLASALLQNDEKRVSHVTLELARMFPHRLYLEVQRTGASGEALLTATAQLAARLNLPLVATHPTQFLREEDFEAHEARVCISEGETLANPRRVRHFTKDQYFKSQQEMQTLFADLPSAVANTVEIAKRCSLSLVLGKPQLPHFPTPEVDGVPMPVGDYFRQLSFAGLQERLAFLYPDEAEREQHRPVYEQRLDFELDIILKMDFPGYFLIVADFINWAKNNECPVGPGRGSGAGSLVAYALKITDLDPLRYNLLFERFLNPERVSMPDFDVDFCQGNRDRVIEYVKERYGRASVSQIATFGTMAARGVVRDVGRVMDYGYNFCDGISKLIPNKPGAHVTIESALRDEPLLAERDANEEEVHQLLEMAQKLEGLTRNVGMHAGGVLIAPGPLIDFCPLYMQPGSDAAVSQFDKDDVEAIGLVKFDFLGLATLTILEQTRQFISRNHADMRDFDFSHLSLDDKATYQLMSEGKTVSVFQLESRGMQGMLRDARPSVFEDVIALVALYRPGPMDLIPSFCARKHGREAVEYAHPLMEPVLRETYGIMIYQEQVMQVAQRLGGYSLGGADLLRRAMGKKKVEEMAKHRAIFAEGAAKNNISQAKADEIFDLMEKFAGYGFNKSHAAAYALLSYYTAWAKVHYTAEFAAGNMTVSIDDTDKLKVFYDDAVEMGIVFEAPDVNRGTYGFDPVSSQCVRYGLGAIKGTGEGAIEAIVQARHAGGPFTTLFDFCNRVDRSRVNKRTVEALIKAGAFDTIQRNRAAMAASVDLAFEYAEQQAQNINQCGLFDTLGEAASDEEPALAQTAPWSIKEQLMREKEAIGFFLSGHLFDEYEREVRRFAKTRIADLVDSREPQLLAGMVTNVRTVNGQRGKVTIFSLEDKSGSIEAVANEEIASQWRDALKDDELLVAQCKLAPDRFSGGLRANVIQLWDLPAARCRFGQFLKIAVNGQTPDVASLIQAFPAQTVITDDGDELRQGVKVRVALHRDGFYAEIDLGEYSRFFPSDAAIARWRMQADQGQAEIIYAG